MATTPGRVRRAATTSVLTVALLVLVGCLVAGRAGYQLVALQTGSMAPTHPAGSLLLEHRQPADQVAVGQVITYRAPTARQQTLTHRVTHVEHSLDGSVTVRTRGDANPGQDPWDAVISDEHVWRVAAGVPLLGTVMAAARSALTHPAGIAGIALMALTLIWAPPRPRHLSPHHRPSTDPPVGGPGDINPARPSADRSRQRQRWRHHRRRAAAAAAVTTIVVAASAGGAQAAWTTNVPRAHAVSSAHLAAPTITSVTEQCLQGLNHVTTTWNSPTDDRDRIRVERRSYSATGVAGTWSTLATTAKAATTYVDTTTSFGARYGYRTTHTAGSWTSTPSPERTINTLLRCL